MERWVGKVAVVTGASTGIGEAIAANLTKQGLKVVGIARRVDKLEKLSQKVASAEGKFYPKKGDITKEEDITSIFKWVESNLGPISILINNAGVYRGLGLTVAPTKDWKLILDTNVIGLSIATREAIKSMKAAKVDGHIVHINSVTGHKVMPMTNMYSASKYAVTALTEALRMELNDQKSKIKISSVSPGAVETDIVNAAGDTVPTEIKKLVEMTPRLKPEDIADAVNYVLATPPNVQIHELIIKSIGEKE